MNKEILDEVLDEFDFEKVQRAMTALDWRWGVQPEPPSIGELRRKARELLNQVVEGRHASVSTGGFTAYMQNGVLGLRFEVSSWEVELEKGIGQ